MNIWVVKTSEMLATDNGNGRVLRSGMIAQMLDARGHDVTWWMSTFDHANRRSRSESDASLPFGSRGTIRMIRSPGYRRSVSAARFLDHALWGKRFARAIECTSRPDIIFCAYPTIESAAVCCDFGRRHSVPVVIDLRDMWPDIFFELVPSSLRPLARAAFLPLRARASSALRSATALFAITEEFLQWGLRAARRPRREFDSAFAQAYPSSSLSSQDKGTMQEAGKFWDERAITRDGSFNVVFIGSITSRRVDVDSVLTVARALGADERRVCFVIAGDGDDLEKYRSLGRDCSNVVFPGWLRAPQIHELLARAHLGLIPYRHSPDYVMSVPTKAAEYFAAGVPVATSLAGTLPRLLQSRQCGLAYDSPDSLARSLRALRDDESLRTLMSDNARRVFQEEFVAETVYMRLVERLEAIAVAAGT